MGIADNVDVDNQGETLLSYSYGRLSTFFSNLRKTIWTNNVPFYESLILVFCEKRPYLEQVAFDAKGALSNCSNEYLEKKKQSFDYLNRIMQRCLEGLEILESIKEKMQALDIELKKSSNFSLLMKQIVYDKKIVDPTFDRIISEIRSLFERIFNFLSMRQGEHCESNAQSKSPR